MQARVPSRASRSIRPARRRPAAMSPAGNNGVQDSGTDAVVYFENNFPGLVFERQRSRSRSDRWSASRLPISKRRPALRRTPVQQPCRRAVERFPRSSGRWRSASRPGSSATARACVSRSVVVRSIRRRPVPAVRRGPERRRRITCPTCSARRVPAERHRQRRRHGVQRHDDGRRTFSGVIRNQIGHGWTQLDGFGFIDAEKAVGSADVIFRDGFDGSTR